MKERDKVRIKEAFLDAVLNSPEPDRVIEGVFTNDGQPMTRRMMAEAAVENSTFYEELERAIGPGPEAIDKYIKGLEKNPPFLNMIQQCPIRPK